MPVHDLGYRAWLGKRMPRILRPLVVAQSGVALVWRRKWLRMMLIFAWLPITVFAILIFAFEYAPTNPFSKRMIVGFIAQASQNPELALTAAYDHTQARHDVWATVIMMFFRVPQLYAMVLLVGIIAPMLVSYDLRSKAYLMYFSRPLSPLEYILGKSAVLWFFLCMSAAVPALALYFVGILLSPGLSTFFDTWDIPLRILGATVVLVVPTTALALCYSSFTSESRYATFSWFATWVLGSISYLFLTGAGAAGHDPGFRHQREGRRPPRVEYFDSSQAEHFAQFAGSSRGDRGGRGQGFDPGPVEEFVDAFGPDNIDYDKWRFLSPYHTLGKVEAWVFGLDTTPASVWPFICLLTAITVICLCVIRHRIVSRLRI